MVNNEIQPKRSVLINLLTGISLLHKVGFENFMKSSRHYTVGNLVFHAHLHSTFKMCPEAFTNISLETRIILFSMV